MTEFKCSDVDAATLISTLPIIQPRYYSVSSSSAIFPSEIHLTVTLVHADCNRMNEMLLFPLILHFILQMAVVLNIMDCVPPTWMKLLKENLWLVSFALLHTFTCPKILQDPSSWSEQAVESHLFGNWLLKVSKSVELIFTCYAVACGGKEGLKS